MKFFLDFCHIFLPNNKCLLQFILGGQFSIQFDFKTLSKQTNKCLHHNRNGESWLPLESYKHKPFVFTCEASGVIEIREKQYKSLMYCHQYFFGGKYDLIQLHRQIIHQNDGISMRNSLKPSPPAFSI